MKSTFIARPVIAIPDEKSRANNAAQLATLRSLPLEHLTAMLEHLEANPLEHGHNELRTELRRAMVREVGFLQPNLNRKLAA